MLKFYFIVICMLPCIIFGYRHIINDNWYHHDFPIDYFNHLGSSRKTRQIADFSNQLAGGYKPLNDKVINWARQTALEDANVLMHAFKRWQRDTEADSFYGNRKLPLF